MADVVLWRPGFFGIKPELVVKRGFICWGAMGDSAASLMTCEPLLMRPQWGAFGRAKQALSACFVNQLAIEADIAGALDLDKTLLPSAGTRKLNKQHMLHNDACPEIKVNPQTFDVYVDGALATCEPAARLPVGADLHVAMTTNGKTLPGVARIGIGGPVGSGKTALVERLIPAFKARNIEVAVVANDIVTQEDAERIKRSGLIDPARVLAVETGACPHTAIREDPTLNIQAVEKLAGSFPELEVVLVESGGDNLASTFSLELVDYWLFVIDTAAGDDIPRKRGLGITRSDLLVINKTDLAPFVGADVDLMVKEANEVRRGRPVMLTNCKTGDGVEAIVDRLVDDVILAG